MLQSICDDLLNFDKQNVILRWIMLVIMMMFVLRKMIWVSH